MLVERHVDMFFRAKGVRHEWQCVQNTSFVQVCVEFKTGFASLKKCTQLINSSYQHERAPWLQCEVTSYTKFPKWIKNPQKSSTYFHYLHKYTQGYFPKAIKTCQEATSQANSQIQPFPCLTIILIQRYGLYYIQYENPIFTSFKLY